MLLMDLERWNALPEGSGGLVDHPDHAVGLLLAKVDGSPRLYLNRCRHLEIPLDTGAEKGDVLHLTGRAFQCSRHGAVFQFRDGRCTSGPCQGQHLLPLTALLTESGVETA